MRETLSRESRATVGSRLTAFSLAEPLVGKAVPSSSCALRNQGAETLAIVAVATASFFRAESGPSVAPDPEQEESGGEEQVVHSREEHESEECTEPCPRLQWASSGFRGEHGAGGEGRYREDQGVDASHEEHVETCHSQDQSGGGQSKRESFALSHPIACLHDERFGPAFNFSLK